MNRGFTPPPKKKEKNRNKERGLSHFFSKKRKRIENKNGDLNTEFCFIERTNIAVFPDKVSIFPSNM